MKRKILVSLALSTLCATMSAGAFAATGSVRVQVRIDGLSELILSGNTAQWYHAEWTPPGETHLNGASWIPTGLSDFCYCLSDVFTGVSPQIPQDASNFAISKSTGRGDVTLLDLPSAQNNYSVRIRFDDLAPGGADDYDVELSYDTDPPPAPKAIPTLGGWGLGLLGLALAGLARRRLR